MQHDESVGRKRANESKPRGSLTSASTVSRVAAHQHAAFSYPSHPILAVSSALALSLVFVTHVHVAPDLGLDAVVPICCKIGWSLAHITCTSTSTRGRYRCPRKLSAFASFFLSDSHHRFTVPFTIFANSASCNHSYLSLFWARLRGCEDCEVPDWRVLPKCVSI